MTEGAKRLKAEKRKLNGRTRDYQRGPEQAIEAAKAIDWGDDAAEIEMPSRRVIDLD
ncbi:hypothetical protein [Rhizobium yanglingense]